MAVGIDLRLGMSKAPTAFNHGKTQFFFLLNAFGVKTHASIKLRQYGSRGDTMAEKGIVYAELPEQTATKIREENY